MAEVFADTIKGTTICAVKKDGKIAVAGDGQVTQGQNVIMKGNAVKVRRIYDGKIVTGFAGSVADAFTLSEKFEEMLQKFSGNLLRAAVEVAQLWRRDNIMRKLEAMMIVADKENRQSWHNLIQLLPSSYNQMRTVTLNYENLINIYYARRTHKLAEWHTLCDWILTLPYARELIAVRDEQGGKN